MSMGTRQPDQPPMWVATSDLPVSPGHPFYARLNALLEAEGFDHDTTTIIETAIAAAEQVEDAQADVDEPQPLEEIIADKGYHSNQSMIDLDAVGIRSYTAPGSEGARAGYSFVFVEGSLGTFRIAPSEVHSVQHFGQ